MHTCLRFLLLSACLYLFSGSAIAADPKTDIDRLVKDKKYLAAAKYIKGRPELMKSDQYLHRYVQILTTYYATTINYDIFGLRDLEPGEDIHKIRGTEGTYELLGPGIEAMLFERLQQNPTSPYANLAVGEYLSRQAACGCGQPSRFTGAKAYEYPYLELAYDAGVKDGWQLFRMGLYWHQQEKPKQAISFYEQSLTLQPTHQESRYNLAVAYYQDGQDKVAEQKAKQALGGYDEPNLNSDTYDLYGSILYSAGKTAQAEKHLRKAMELQAWHPHAFQTLAQLYREQKQEKKYRELVLDYVALDYSDVELFGRYIEFLSNNGFSPYDAGIVKVLGQQKYKKPVDTGSVHYNLGRLAQGRGDKQQARKHYRTSLAAMKKIKNPPEGSIQALESLLKDAE